MFSLTLCPDFCHSDSQWCGGTKYKEFVAALKWIFLGVCPSLEYFTSTPPFAHKYLYLLLLTMEKHAVQFCVKNMQIMVKVIHYLFIYLLICGFC